MIDSLLRDGYRFDFFQAVRLLERHYQQRAQQSPDRRRYPVGQDYPLREVAHLRALPSLGFPAQMIDSVGETDELALHGDDPLLEMTVTFIGLFGPSGVLPQHYTSMLLSRLREKDYALRDFLDLFNHRTISLFYRAWEKYRLPFMYERSHFHADEDDLFTFCLYSLVGLSGQSMRDRSGIDDEAFLYYSGHFSHRPPTASALERMVAEFFDLPIAVEQFCGGWLRLPPGELTRLQSVKSRQSYNYLGDSAVIGERVWDVQGRFRIVVGPVTAEQFRNLIPSGDAIGPLVKMARSYVGIEYDFDVMVVLPPSEVPHCGLGVENPDAPRLGWNIWVRSRDFEQPVRDAVYHLPTI